MCLATLFFNTGHKLKDLSDAVISIWWQAGEKPPQHQHLFHTILPVCLPLSLSQLSRVFFLRVQHLLKEKHDETGHKWDPGASHCFRVSLHLSRPLSLPAPASHILIDSTPQNGIYITRSLHDFHIFLPRLYNSLDKRMGLWNNLIWIIL